MKKTSVKETVKNINAMKNNINPNAITEKQAVEAAETYYAVTEAYKAKVQEIEDQMQDELTQAEACKALIKEYGKQQGDALFGDASTVRIIATIELTRRTQQPDVKVNEISAKDLKAMANATPKAFKIDLAKLNEAHLPLIAKAIVEKEDPYTYSLKSVDPKKTKSSK